MIIDTVAWKGSDGNDYAIITAIKSDDAVYVQGKQTVKGDVIYNKVVYDKINKVEEVCKGEVQEIKPSKTKGESKSTKAKALYIETEDKSRKGIIALFVKELGMSEAGASTYYFNCKKACGG